MKAIITRDIEIKGRLETPKINASRSLKAGPHPQTLPRWMIEQAIRRGAATKVEPRRARKKSDDEVSSEAAGE